MYEISSAASNKNLFSTIIDAKETALLLKLKRKRLRLIVIEEVTVSPQ